MAATTVKASRLARVAGLVDQLISTVEVERLSRTQAEALRTEIDALVALLKPRRDRDARALAQALGRLSAALSRASAKRRSARSDAAQGRIHRNLRRIAMILAAGAALSIPVAAAAATPPVGGLIFNPVTNANETVVEILNGSAVRTNLNNVIVTAGAVNDVLPNPDGGVFTVTAVIKDGDNQVVSLVVKDAANAPSVINVVTAVTTAPSAPPGGTIALPSAAGDVNFYSNGVRRGNGGGGGDDGALFVSADSGDDGDPGPNFSVDAGDSLTVVSTVSDNLPGVLVASIGGDGGSGGDGYLGASGASGGNGGHGGDVSLISRYASISTSGDGSHGVVVQSRAGVGGPGGGGYGFSVGGSGGGGSSGGSATVTNYSNILTEGKGAHGVFAQSLGGGAGSGGSSYGIFGSGGAGNTGGHGGHAEAINYGHITTTGENAYGVSAMSVGGIGGDAGNSGGLVSFTQDGASGGNGGTAIVRAQAGSTVNTSGAASYGLFAQSIGGGGGSGGVDIALVSLGSGGGTGGDGGSAQIYAQDGTTVSTAGLSAHGVFAQSIGGGGGNGGIAGGVVAFGSSGNSGGIGGAVIVESGAAISTTGVDARGIFAESIGGGGGSAAGSGGVVALGGSGSVGGGAGSVTVTTSSASSVVTRGEGADGIVAQSIGGGGGSGSTSGGVFAMGGTGDGGGDGGVITLINHGSVETHGINARGLFAQSVGGGGGTGGSGYGLASLGATGGGGSSGGAVTLTNTGSITTTGNQSSALQAQSMGGGGGDGGTSGAVFLAIGGSGDGGGPAGLVTVNHSGALFTGGDDAHGIFAQSVGGGGGNGGSSGSMSAFAGVAIGGSGDSGGAGGDVILNLTPQTVLVGGSPQSVDPLIVTTGDRSRGVFVQSVGGGGGNGGFAAQVSAGYGVGASAAVGGDGADGGAGGVVTVDGNLTIATSGDNSEGFFAQSVGGGGGNGGFALSFAFSAGETASASFSVALGGKGGGGGAGGLVDIDSGGTILTEGDFSTGFLAQSVGGGGGNGGYAVSVSGAAAGVASASFAVGVGGQGGSGGLGGLADATFDGDILTRGDDARGAVIQSVGGGGGNGGWAVAGAVAFSGTASVGASAGVGGSGGTGGAGGTATGHIGGHVATEGDRSTAVTVQSVGGGGGSGGFSVAGAVGGAGVFGGGVSVGVGGAGGGGGDGGSATGTMDGLIQTMGDQSTGFLVQSVGGGGGAGGFSVSGAIGGGGTVGAGLAIGLGGAGGGGGVGGTAWGQAHNAIRTFGDQSTAMIVQSLGGGGGSGGFNVSGSISGGGTVGAGASIGIGGSGGAGGAGGAATGVADDIIQTAGDQSDGLLVQSVGGGGGAGGWNVSGAIAGGGTAGVGAAVGLGGSGGGGGAGGAVRGEAHAAVATLGDQSGGVIVQSLGGGGGSGGFNVSGSIGGGGDAGVGISVGVGGAGGGGGAGGEVDASAVSIATGGDQSGGFLAQSVGGGGGNGGFNVAGSIGAAGTAGAGLSVGVGGAGGGGGAGARVGATVTGDVITLGDDSDGIVAQSIGGGGGSGGFNVAGAIGASGTAAGAISVGVGGSGGGGGGSGAVTLAVTGLTGTAGANSDAILAQSVGGGGGNGGFNVTGNIAASGSGAGTVGVGVGGMGGGGGSSGDVDLTVQGVGLLGGVTIAAVTVGDDARAIVAQSLGGGGGNGGFNVTGGIAASKDGAGNIGVGVGGGGGDGGDSATVDATVTGDIQTAGRNASGLLAQSVGGGGGNGGFNVTGGLSAAKTGSGNLMVGVGGFGGDGGNSGDVSGGLTGDVLTLGDDAFAVTYQSLGGGGGNGGFNITGGISLAMSGGGAGNVGVGVGGFGGDGGDAGDVDATIIGDLTTGGEKAHGALLQSVGGGGGNGGFNVTGGISASSGVNGTLGFGLGGFGGGGGNSGDVIGVLQGDVATYGDNAFGVLLQSLGGGGGNGGFNVTGAVALTVGDNAAVGVGIGIGGFAGGGGDAGDVTGSITGLYQTAGDNADGVIAQSLGGGGGNGGLNVTGAVAIGGGASASGSIGIGGFGGSGGDSGDVSLIRVGDTATGGENSDGVLVQSLAGGGGSGGINISGGLAATTKGSAGALGIGVGGFGGDGGDAGDVTAHVTGNVWARGMGADYVVPEELITGILPGPDDDTTIPAYRVREDGSHGVLVQSVGGGGGNGGLNVTGGIAFTPPGGDQGARSVMLGVGGFGGAGGDAGEAHLTLDGPSADRVQVSAIGDERYAVAVQSIGGGGGAGGINVSGGIAVNGSLTTGIGGFGSAGGLGADVTADVDADLFAAGNRSRGLLVQSVGGGGGAGGINITGGVSADPANKEPSVSFGVGGFGGAGNSAGDVDARQLGQIVVEGVDAHGILVQSVGGGGGDGGLNVTANAQLGAAKQGERTRGIAIGVGVGGTGGDGADGGNVTLDSVGDIFVNAVADPDGGLQAAEYTGGSVGVLVQSIGGGGGVGGINVTGVVAPSGQPAAIGIGGSGGSGGDAGTVSVERGYEGATAAPGVIRTFGDDSDGMLIQSIGGGGGRAGVNAVFALTKATGDNNPLAALIAVGGSGAGAGSGDDVSVRHNGEIWTSGRDSDGMLVQSIGGGGGSGNYNIGLGVLKGATALNLAVGGGTGAGGTGADVTVDHVGTIVTTGDLSSGIHAQSIGGGGGSTGMDMATGLLADNSLDISIGRHGGAGGSSGDVSVHAAGAIETSGETSDGILAQSIGGGGGESSATSIGGSRTTGKGDQAKSYSASVAVGLEGGVGASSGDVSVAAEGQIATHGKDSRGVFAQSVGGGGGRGGSTSNVIVNSAGAATVGVGGTGGTGAISGDVSVDSAALIVTDGENSDGILAQSIGGGGGMGGVARTIALQVGGVPPSTNSRSMSVNVGGTGGTGAVGGDVDVTNTGVITTKGLNAFGVRAQSIGGGGGIGGMVLNARLQYRGSDSIDVNIGGSGGTGGAGGAVNVLNEGLIFTEGKDAAGISANSIGGGGGDAGLILDVAGGLGTNDQSHRVAINIGGDGGTGGVGGSVSVINRPTAAENTGLIVTRGEGAYGVFAQSLGGGGGNGSSVLSLSGMITGKDSFLFGLNIGGSGGSGNTGGSVDVLNAGVIDTTGAGAHGILAQSIGGGGGNGGIAFAGNLLLAASTNVLTHAPLITVGGFGGDGGDGGTVTVTNTGDIVTRGADAHGIVAQSIGGGGGNAQMGFGLTPDVGSLILSSTVSALVGNFGGGVGGTGGDVTVNHSGDITVLGDGSRAILAQSINGGGGSLTFDFSGIVGLPGAPFIDIHGDTVVPDPLVEARAGGFGAVDSNAGAVVTNDTGSYGVGGDNGVGSFIQAVGGGGGSLVMRAAISPVAPPAAASSSSSLVPAAVPLLVAIPFQMGLGGTNGVNNNGGDIDSTHAGDIVTTGFNSPGAVIQSVGGGGGLGLLDVTAPAGALIGDVDVSLGGVNGTNESGGAVTRAQTGVVVTTGDLSPAMVLQSIGGGGGSASVILHGDDAAGAVVHAALGSAGGSGLNGGSVSGDLSGGVETYGDHALGLVAQSIGGGGGELRLAGMDAATVTLGGSAGATGDGGVIDLANDGAIITTGAASHAVFLQSIGGGGGAVFGAFAPTAVVSSDNVGDGGSIAFAQTGDIITLGDGAYGLVAQSLGGGGGWVDGGFAGSAGGDGAGGAIDLSVSGSVFAAGADSVGVFAQSVGSLGGGDILVDVDGLVRGGSAGGAGVRVDGGATNLILASGSISAVSGLAIDATTGDDTVRSDGVVIGDIDLGSGTNAFDNHAGGTFIAFHSIDLRDGVGSSGVFTNDGDFAMGLGAPSVPLDLANGETFADVDANGDPTTNLLYGARVINDVALDGDFVQTASGDLAFDIAFGPFASDHVDVTGDAAVDGTGDITLTWLENSDEVTLFSTGGVGVDNGLDIRDTLAMDYSVRGDDAGIHLSFVTNFAQPFMNENERQLGVHMDSAIGLGGSGGIGRLMALIGNLQVGDEALYRSIFTTLNPEPFVASMQTQYDNAGVFSRSLFHCGAPGVAVTDQCVWSSFETAAFDREADPEHYGVETHGVRVGAGFERPLGDGWSLAGAVGYDDIDRQLVDRSRAVSDGEGYHAGIGVKHVGFDGFEMNASLAAGWQYLDTTRNIDVFGPEVGQSSPETGYVRLNARMAQTFRSGVVFVRPALNASVTALHQAGFEEQGLAGLGIAGLADTDLYGTLNPEVSLGVLLHNDGFSQSALTLTMGVLLQSSDAFRTPYRLLGSNPDAMPAQVAVPLDDEAWRVGVELQVYGDERLSLRTGYTAQGGETSESQSLGLNLRMKF